MTGISNVGFLLLLKEVGFLTVRQRIKLSISDSELLFAKVYAQVYHKI